MITSPNYQIYSNPEAYALEVLKQKLSAEAQRAAQQSMLEYTAMKSFLGQGQMIFCVPCGGGPSEVISNITPMQCSMSCQPCPVSLPQSNANLPPIPLRAAQTTQNFQQIPLQTSGQPVALPATSVQQPFQQSNLLVYFRNTPQKNTPPFQPGADDCSLGQDFIEIVLDLIRFMPAEVNLNIEDRLIEIKANHSDQQGNKTFSRRYDLPAAIIVEATKCVLSYDGILYVCAPWHKME